MPISCTEPPLSTSHKALQSQYLWKVYGLCPAATGAAATAAPAALAAGAAAAAAAVVVAAAAAGSGVVVVPMRTAAAAAVVAAGGSVVLPLSLQRIWYLHAKVPAQVARCAHVATTVQQQT